MTDSLVSECGRNSPYILPPIFCCGRCNNFKNGRRLIPPGLEIVNGADRGAGRKVSGPNHLSGIFGSPASETEKELPRSATKPSKTSEDFAKSQLMCMLFAIGMLTGAVLIKLESPHRTNCARPGETGFAGLYWRVFRPMPARCSAFAHRTLQLRQVQKRLCGTVFSSWPSTWPTSTVRVAPHSAQVREPGGLQALGN
jgi:hypothetical protein